jgi:hypothetical protein
MFEKAEQLGVGQVSPAPAYKYAFPFAQGHLEDLAYFFEGEFALSECVREYASPVRKVVKLWKESRNDSVLVSVDKGQATVIVDTRPCSKAPTYISSALRHKILCETSRAITLESLITRLDPERGRDSVEDEISNLIKRRFIVGLDGWLLCVAIPLSEHYPPVGRAAVAFVGAVRGATEGENITIPA